MSNVKVERLKLCLWQELLYLFFVMLVPAAVSACEVFSSHSTVFKITFSSIGSILMTVIIVRKFVFKSHVMKLQDKCLLNEHDYEIDVGDKDKLRKTWAIYNIIILAYHAIVMLLSVVLTWLFVNALADQIIKFKGAITIILISVFVGILLRFSFFWTMTRSKESTDE